MKELFQHVAVTDGITVRVAVNFLPEQSRIEAGKWFWVYHIRIENDSAQAVQLLSRNPDPSIAQIKDAFTNTAPSPHLCRCGTYLAIIDAVRRAAKAMRE